MNQEKNENLGNSPTHCLIVEDHIQARRWLSETVKKAFGLDARTTDSVKAARAAIDECFPDLALVDLGLPDGSGIEIISELSAQRFLHDKEVTIIVSTVMNDDESIFNAIRAGADGYILKEESQTNLITMLHGIRENKPPLSPLIAMRLLNFFREESNDQPLAPRETQVLQLLAKGFTVPRVAEMLDITANTASSYVKEIYRKLDINSRAEATIEATRRGLV